GWTPALSCAVACELLKRAGCPVSVGHSPSLRANRKLSGKPTAVSSILHQLLLSPGNFKDRDEVGVGGHP
ncbi:unnamed protein product, partial [Ectocarpus sp. 12 AP-2014]